MTTPTPPPDLADRLVGLDTATDGTDDADAADGPDAAGGLDDTAALAPVDAAVNDARVVGFGEASHAVRELHDLIGRLLARQIREHGVRVVGLEANVAEVRALDRYVTGVDSGAAGDGGDGADGADGASVAGASVEGTPVAGVNAGDAAAALSELAFWIWQTAGLRRFVEWVRRFNAGRPAGDRVRLHGVDCQAAHGSAVALARYFDRVDPAVTDRLADEFAVARDGLFAHYGATDDGPTPERVAAVERLADETATRLADDRERYVAADGRATFERARHHARVVGQATDLAAAREEGQGTAYARLRDAHMADNVEWLLAHGRRNTMDGGSDTTTDTTTGRGGGDPATTDGESDTTTGRDGGDGGARRVAVWAAVGHLQRGPGSIGADGDGGPLGFHLDDRLGDDYRPVAVTFGHGAVRTVDRETEAFRAQRLAAPPDDTAHAAFLAATDGVAFLDCTALDDATADWLADRRVHAVSPVYDPDCDHGFESDYRVDLGDDFAGVVFVPEVQASRLLEQVRE